MKINITEIIVDEFDKIEFTKQESYVTYLAIRQKENELEKKYPELQKEFGVLSDLYTNYQRQNFDEFAEFAIDFFRCLHK